MDTPSAISPTPAGPSHDAANSSSAYDEDSASRHFATTASQVPIPTGLLAPAAVPSNAPLLETSVKDVKSHGTRFHEDGLDTDQPSPRLKSSRMFKGKGKDAVCIEKERKKPVHLLDLPVDILKDIVKEVTHTNDLTSLALCHSALHRLTTPHIYSRFDIVWPDNTTHAEPRSGVDALTYGLATLVMAEEIFEEAPSQQSRTLTNRFNIDAHGRASDLQVRRRRGNHYAQFTRKFSLGNGPTEWVQEYLITKEGGKMLGTLVALAVARMRALETFIWDMPTGILRDVWLALSSLGDRDDGQSCRLEKVWVRWHDNTPTDTAPSLPPPPPLMNLANTHTSPATSGATASLPPQIHPAALDRVEHPCFSVLPPLKSLSVLDIDELAYLDEMAVLIGRSLDKLRELRVGIARQAVGRTWTSVWEGEQLQQVDRDYPTAGSLTIGEKRLGGILGTLTGFVCDIRKPRVAVPEQSRRRSAANRPRATSPVRNLDGVADIPREDDLAPVEHNDQSAVTRSSSDTNPEVESAEAPETSIPAEGSQPLPIASPTLDIDTPITPSMLNADLSHATDPEPPEPSDAQAMANEQQPALDAFETEVTPEEPYLNNTLKLDSLELERVPLSVPLLQKAIDWSRLTSLTLLHCQNHEPLWKTLRRNFAPTPRSPIYPHPRRTPNASPKKAGKLAHADGDVELEYTLKLKKIHTNTVSPALVSFLKETLAPNSLEVLFLQESRNYDFPVTVDQIFKGPLRRHRNSLKKVLIDSSEKSTDGSTATGNRWKRWMLTRDILSFICGGKMPALRELGMALDYRDWVSRSVSCLLLLLAHRSMNRTVD